MKAGEIEKVLAEFKGLKRIPRIKDPHGRRGITVIKDSEGNQITNKKEIADVFADFYTKLYVSKTQEAEDTYYKDQCPDPVIDAFTLEELEAALKKMKRGKAKDDTGVIAEMFKDGSEGLLQAILELFNDIASLKQDPPDEWRKTKLVVIFKR